MNFLVHYDRRLMAAAAPAEARSCFELVLLAVTLGRLLLLFPAIAAPVLVRLDAVEPGPLMADCLRGTEGLLGLLPDTSLLFKFAGFLKLVAGGSGRGLLPVNVVVMVL